MTQEPTPEAVKAFKRYEVIADIVAERKRINRLALDLAVTCQAQAIANELALLDAWRTFQDELKTAVVTPVNPFHR